MAWYQTSKALYGTGAAGMPVVRAGRLRTGGSYIERGRQAETSAYRREKTRVGYEYFEWITDKR